MTIKSLHQPSAHTTAALECLSQARSASDLRDNLRNHYPAFDVDHVNQIAIVGAAGEGVRLAGLCLAEGIKVVAIVDDHPAKIGTELAGQPVQSVGSLQGIDRSVPIIVASHRALGATQRLRSLGFTTVLPFAALQTMAPDLFPPHMFYDGLLDDLWKNRERYALLSDQLSDRRSRDVLDAVLNFRQTLDPSFISPVLDDDDLYAPKNLIEFTTTEVYVDGGSYDGDTIRSFAKIVHGRFDHVYAFEPDPVTYHKLQSNFATEPRVEPINAGLHREKGVLRFKDDGSRGAIFASDGTITMPVTSLDDVLGQKPVTYIKMNIEGAEIDALYGAEQAIRRERPKLAISVYHRPSDLWRIPEIVAQFGADYQMFLRQHDGGIIETVLYAIPKT
jgi:FkbM family methyltransferase